MLKKERAEIIVNDLEKMFPKTPIPLDHINSYTLLIAVLLSAQCTDLRVNKITPQLFENRKNPFEMIKLSIIEIEKIIKPCGLAPRKSKAIWQLSNILIDKYDGQVPSSFEELEELPGVGHKTASVVMSQAFDVPAFPVDTHIHRIAQQWGLTNGKNVVQTEKDLKACFPKDKWNKLHLQIIFYGRKYCTARQCDGISCILCKKLYPKRRNIKEYKKA